MEVEGAKPANFSGVPLILLWLSFVLIMGLPRLAQDMWYLSVVGWLFLSASWGTSIEVKEGTLKLRYVFNKLTINVPLSEIEEVKVISRLEKAVLIREFAWLYLLISGAVLLAFFDLLLLPSGLLEGYYFGDVGLIFFGVLYIAVMSLPFNRINIAILFGILDLFFAALLMRLKMGFVDPVSVLVFVIFALLFVADYHSKDYVLIETPKGKYLIITERPEVVLHALLRRVTNA